MGHLVEGTAGLEPGDLGIVHCVVQLYLVCGAIGMLQNTAHRLQRERERERERENSTRFTLEFS